MSDEDAGRRAVRLAREKPASNLDRARDLGFTGPWFHGTERLDRLLSKKGLDPKRATSGPMPYFTDNPQIASNYAEGKQDTSRVAADEGDVSEYFKVHPKHLGWSGRTPIPVERTWMFLPKELRDEITSKISRVGYEDPDTSGGDVILHPEGKFASLSSQDHLDHMLREHRGNALTVLRDLWHDGGNLYGQEEELAKIFKLTGYPHPIDQSDAPWITAKGVLPAMLRMRNPLDAMNHRDILERVIPHLEREFARDRSRRQEYGVDQWEKNHRWTPKEWIADLKKAAEAGKSSYTWTSIPDKITNSLKRLGHDSVIDRGAKMDPGTFGDHTVAIPFHPHQVRSTMARFDPEQLDSQDIMKAGGGSVEGDIPAFSDIRPPRENLASLIDANFESAKVHGHHTVPIEALSGGSHDADRVRDLAQKFMAPGAYFERPVVDDIGNVIEGQHRLSALRQVGAKHVPVTIIRDFGRGFPGHAVRKALDEKHGLHSDHRNQIASMLAAIYGDARGSVKRIREGWSAPRGFEQPWATALDALEKNRVADTAKSIIPKEGRPGRATGGAADDKDHPVGGLNGFLRDVKVGALDARQPKEVHRAMTRLREDGRYHVANIPLNHLIGTQSDVNGDFHKAAGKYSDRHEDLPAVYRVKGVNYVTDGHHRLAAEASKGVRAPKVRLYDVDEHLSGERLDRSAPLLERRLGGRINANPTEAQKEAGNYKKGHLWVQGLDISIENHRGSKRSGVDQSGKPWSCTLPADYGYVRGTEGADGDHVDVYLGPDRSSPIVFVVNQNDHRTGRFDEHKCMIGYRSESQAVRDYCAAFSDGRGAARIGSVETMSMDAFKHWLRTGRTTVRAKAAPIIERALKLTARAR